MSEEISPVIVLPESETRREQLRIKLEEYRGRLDKFLHPGAQMDAICKITVLERLLRDGQVSTWDLSMELQEKYGKDFDVPSYENACGVVADYVATGGVRVEGGTGLPD